MYSRISHHSRMILEQRIGERQSEERFTALLPSEHLKKRLWIMTGSLVFLISARIGILDSEMTCNVVHDDIIIIIIIIIIISDIIIIIIIIIID